MRKLKSSTNAGYGKEPKAMAMVILDTTEHIGGYTGYPFLFIRNNRIMGIG
jgi:hypothetical protein